MVNGYKLFLDILARTRIFINNSNIVYAELSRRHCSLQYFVIYLLFATLTLSLMKSENIMFNIYFFNDASSLCGSWAVPLPATRSN